MKTREKPFLSRSDPSSPRWRRPRNHAPEPLIGPPGCNYPSSDGRPMAENTIQYRWIVTIQGGLDDLFRDDPDVLVVGDLMWYPVEEKNRRRLAPDAMVIFGRPKGDRPSYKQHEEAGIAPQVVFEIWSPGNRRRVIEYKFKFYERHGVEEYYTYNPDKLRLEGWLREGDILRPVAEMNGWVSPRLGIRFEMGDDLTIYRPDGRPFGDYVHTARRADAAAQRADEEARRADAAAQRADEEARRADAAAQRADEEARRADAAMLERDEAARRAERLAAKLRALGLEPED